MEGKRGSNVVAGLLLILLGAGFMAVQLMPGLRAWVDVEHSWPLIVVGVGVLLLFLGLLVGAPAMAVPACIVGGVGGLLYWQNTTGNWESWAYVWTLIPAFVGVGVVLSGLLGVETRKSVREGAGLILISLVLFAVFGSFLGGLGLFGPYWPILLIALGLLVFVRSFFRFR